MSGMYKRRIRKGVAMQDQNTDLTQSTNQQLLIFHEAETQRRSTASLHPFQAGVEWREEFSTLLYTLPAACVFAIHRFYFFPPTTTTVHSYVFVLDLGMVLLTIYSSSRSRYTTHWQQQQHCKSCWIYPYTNPQPNRTNIWKWLNNCSRLPVTYSMMPPPATVFSA